jgi:nucleoside-diphosphate-sugar epimerase
MLMEANETVAEYSHKYGLQTTIFQPTMIYGSSRDRNISKIINIVRKYHILPVFGDGKCLRQPVYVRDVVSAIIASIDCPASFGKIYDLGGLNPLSYNEMVQIIAKELQTSLRIVHMPIGIALGLLKVCKPLSKVLTKESISRFAEDRVVNIQPAIKDLNYQPYSFEEGVKLQIQNLK